jgi:hypothetical protein
MPPTTAELYNHIATDLQAKVEELGGVFSRARDPFEVIELLSNAPGKFRVIFADLGDEKAGEAKRPAFVTCAYTVTLSMNRGLPMIKGSAISLPREGGAPSLLAMCDTIADWLRGLTLPDGTSGHLDYQGRDPVKYEGVTLDAYELRFSCIRGLSSITARP